MGPFQGVGGVPIGTDTGPRLLKMDGGDAQVQGAALVMHTGQIMVMEAETDARGVADV